MARREARRAAALRAVVPGPATHDALAAEVFPRAASVRVRAQERTRPLPRVAVDVVKAPGVGLVAADVDRHKAAVVESVVLGHPVVVLVRVLDEAHRHVGVEGEIAEPRVPEVGEAGEVRVQAAEPERRGGSGAASVFPLGLGGEVELLSRPLAEPVREGHGPAHGDSHHGLSRPLTG